MNKRWLSLLILFICLSMAGIILVQYLWIRNAMKIREAQFNQQVNEALGTVVDRLETTENLSLLSARLISDSIRDLIRTLASDSASVEQLQIDAGLLHDLLNDNPVHWAEKKVVRADPQVRVQPEEEYSKQYQQAMAKLYGDRKYQQSMDSIMSRIRTNLIVGNDWVNIQFEWESSQLERLDSMWVVQEEYIQRIPSDGRSVSVTAGRPSRNTYYFQDPQPPPERPDERRKTAGRFVVTHHPPDPIIVLPPPPENQSRHSASKVLEEKIKKLDRRASQLQDLIQRMAVEFEEIPKTIETRIDKTILESTLKSSLADKEIAIPFEFAVFSPQNDGNPIPIRSAGYLDKHEAIDHEVSLFPNDVFEKPDQLLVYFPGQKSHILKSLSVLMLGSILFTLIIMFSSGLSIFVIVRQKKISDIKTDFINNMTHEFKTPIATISIAADSINNPKVIDSPDQIKSYTRIIKEENSRMNTRVEQVLQMSLLDSRDFNLQLEPLNLHKLISRTVDHFRLIVEKRGGTIEARFDASNPLVLADEGHMRNVLTNLFDNANKYSVSQPVITITTGNRADQFFFSVEDQGMGMTQETQKRVFDKFFRLTTGNVHNIKGFGLGLSYVKAIVLAHHGEIKLASETDKGSRFEISLPVMTRDEGRET
ncbi:MAG: sensor histidine kinase [Bacteroidetes bacterium]|nr:MAG: sensor histidine kinase [Bacteroidota bacterium]